MNGNYIEEVNLFRFISDSLHSLQTVQTLHAKQITHLVRLLL